MNPLQQRAANVKTANEEVVFSVLGAVSAGLVASGKVEPTQGQSVDQAIDNLIATAPEWVKTAIRLAATAGAAKANTAAASGIQWGPTLDTAELVFMVAISGDDLSDMPM